MENPEFLIEDADRGEDAGGAEDVDDGGGGGTLTDNEEEPEMDMDIKAKLTEAVPDLPPGPRAKTCKFSEIWYPLLPPPLALARGACGASSLSASACTA